MIEELINELIEDEDIRLKPYKCTAGKLTIGIGRNLDDRGITEGEARYLCMNDIQNARIDLEHIFGDVKHFSENRQKALLNMMFNLGYNKFTGFKKMIVAIKSNDWHEAAEQAKDSRWYRQVGKSRSERIITRLREG